MSEILYNAQQYFPKKCVNCPFLVGRIEDGDISPEDPTQEEVMSVIEEEAKSFNFETCPGPKEENTPDGLSISCMGEISFLKS